MPMAEIEFEILDDGTVKWKTGRIPDAHHDDADALQDELAEILGGEVKKTHTAGGQGHVHHHGKGGHVHEGGGHDHTH